eukprot:5011486-Pyramimonas_sp.AAC.2
MGGRSSQLPSVGPRALSTNPTGVPFFWELTVQSKKLFSTRTTTRSDGLGWVERGNLFSLSLVTVVCVG